MKIGIDQEGDEIVVTSYDRKEPREFLRVTIRELITTYLNLYYPISTTNTTKS